MSTSLESRYGLSFGATTIVASRFNSSGLIELTDFPASSDYRSWYTQTVNHFGESSHDIEEANVTSILIANVEPIIEDLARQDEKAPEIATLFLPSIFDWKVRSVADDAVFSNAQYATRAASTRKAACYGYGFLKGDNLGRPISECNDDGPTSLVLLLEYEKEYLYAWLIEVEFELDVYSAEQDHICKECGEKYREIVGSEAYQERLDKFLREFVEVEVLSRYKREDIRAIIISGEASATCAEELGKAALNAVGTEEVKLMKNFEPSKVVAHGAAVFARLTEEHPEDFMTHSGNIVPDDEAYWAEVAARRAREEAEHNEL
ncbi:hypothetical protein DE146DRAFT_607170 [Phaeosphaeria sp. MPI-PUGE-AT-0046c]|nr:hypothetical protein DE146DRAFT_607170 [Phaeosphaeria sp. MPI-PUGE-AT-0046c]